MTCTRLATVRRASGIYAYQVWLYKVPIVVTVDLSAYWEHSEPWIKANCFDLFLPGPCY